MGAGGGAARDHLAHRDAPADLLVFREDPTRDLAALATLEAVIADGRLYGRSDLEAALDTQRRHFEGPLYDRVTIGLADLLLPATD